LNPRFAAVLTTLLILPILLATAASPAEARYAAIVIEADSGRILHEANADTRNHPASLTKMMTLYMLFEALEDKRLSLDQALPVSRRAAGMPSSKLGLRRGTSITVKNAILALVTKSANDVAVVVAEALAGTEVEFAKLMTKKAQALGMRRTTFRNASGLYNKRQLSTARDMATLAQALIRDFPDNYSYFSVPNFTYDGRRHRNHNKLLRSYAGTDGLKTGYIAAAGYNLAASARRDGHRVIAVLFGGRTSKSRNRHVAKLLDRGFRRLSDPIYVAQGGVVDEQLTPPPAKPVAPTVVRGQVASNDTQTSNDTQASDNTQSRVVNLSSENKYGVQVGAFYRYPPAEKAAENARAKVPNLLAGSRVAITHINGDRGRIYRSTGPA
jgi:D-alanyl-D-alanine carboxypeptidase